MTLLIATKDKKTSTTWIASDGLISYGNSFMVLDSNGEEEHRKISIDHRKWIEGKNCCIGICGMQDKTTQFKVAFYKFSELFSEKIFSEEPNKQYVELFESIVEFSKRCKSSDWIFPPDGHFRAPIVIHENIYDCKFMINTPQTACCEPVNHTFVFGSGQDYAMSLLDYLFEEGKLSVESILAKTIEHTSRHCPSVGGTARIYKIERK